MMNCWICEGWVEHTLSWTLGESGLAAKEPVYIHLDFDMFMPRHMKKEGGMYNLTLMIPPGNHEFFYTFFYVAQASNSYKKILREEPLDIKDMYFYDENRIVDIRTTFINTIYVKQQPVLNSNYEPVP
jgi:hypothetical protein